MCKFRVDCSSWIFFLLQTDYTFANIVLSVDQINLITTKKGIYLYSAFRKVNFHGHFLSHEDVRIFCFGEELFKNFKLSFSKCRSLSALFSRMSCVKRKRIVNSTFKSIRQVNVHFLLQYQHSVKMLSPNAHISNKIMLMMVMNVFNLIGLINWMSENRKLI